MTIDLAGAFDELYGVLPEEFVLVRSRLERELRSAGDTEAAADIKRRRRPHLAAWAINQLARQDPAAIEELWNATNETATAQRSTLGGADPEELRASTRRRHDVLQTLTDSGVRLLAGHAPKPEQYRDNIAATLDAATMDEAAGAALRAGQLTQPLLPPARFGPLDAMAAPPGGASDARRPTKRDIERAKRAVDTAKEAAEKAARDAEQADAEVASADLEAESALSHLEDVDRARERARDSLSEANSRLSEAQRQAIAAQRALREAKLQWEEAEARLTETDQITQITKR